MVGLTVSVESTIIDNVTTTDVAIAAVLNGVTTAHIYGVFCVPISNTQSRVIMVYD